jgi:hypothetical protein
MIHILAPFVLGIHYFAVIYNLHIYYCLCYDVLMFLEDYSGDCLCYDVLMFREAYGDDCLCSDISIFLEDYGGDCLYHILLC